MATVAQIQQALQAAQQAGNAQDVAALQQALAQAQQAPEQPQGPTREQLSNAFYAAQQAGNQDDARQIIGYIQKNGMTLVPMSPDQVNAGVQQQNAANVAGMSGVGKFMAGAGKAAVDTGRGIGQLIGTESPQDIANAQQSDQALMNTGAGKLGNLAGQAGIMYAGGSLLKGGLGLAGVAQKALPYVSSALTGGAFSGAQPVTGGESRALNAGLGTALGAAGEALPGAIGAAAKKAAPAVSAAKQAALDTAEKYGIPLHLNQVTDSKFLQTLGAAAKYLPFSGTAAADNAQRMAFNKALAGTIGQGSATELSPEVINAAKAANSQGYNQLFDNNTVQIPAQTWMKLGSIAKQADHDLPPEQAQIVKNQIDKYVQAAQANNGVIPGRLYQNVRATVQSVEGQNTPAKYLVGQVRKAFQGAADKSFGPEGSASKHALDTQYKNLKLLDKALGQAQGANYSVTPANLWRLTQGKYGASPEMLELAQLGQTVLKNPIADSGTAQRLLAYRMLEPGALGGLATGAAFAPHVVGPFAAGLGAGATVGRLMNSPLAARVLPGSGSRLLGLLGTASQPANRLLPLLAPQAASVVGNP